MITQTNSKQKTYANKWENIDDPQNDQRCSQNSSL